MFIKLWRFIQSYLISQSWERTQFCRVCTKSFIWRFFWICDLDYSILKDSGFEIFWGISLLVKIKDQRSKIKDQRSKIKYQRSKSSYVYNKTRNVMHFYDVLHVCIMCYTFYVTFCVFFVNFWLNNSKSKDLTMQKKINF